MYDAKKEFGQKVTDLIMKTDLSREDTRDLFGQVLLDLQPDAQQGAFLAAITAKGATPDELAGIWDAIYDLDTAKVNPNVSDFLVDNCGTGMDNFQTFNISTAASIVAAAGGITMAKHGARAITSVCGTIDILETLGIDVECDVSLVQRSIEKAGIGIFNGMNPKVHPVGLGRILSKICFGTVLNISGSLANPVLPKYGVRGVYSKDLVIPIVQTMRAIGYVRSVVFHGLNGDGRKGMDEISPSGETYVGELFSDGEISMYKLTPQYFDIEPIDERLLAPANSLEDEAVDFLRVISGDDMGAREDTVCINAAPIFYIAGKARDMKEGFDISKEIVQSGKALVKLNQWVEVQNSDSQTGLNKLRFLIEKAANYSREPISII